MQGGTDTGRTFYGSPEEARLKEELHGVLERRIASVNRQWDTSRFDPETDPITADFQGRQFAPWYPDETYAAAAEGWAAGNLEAAIASRGQGWRWTVRDVTFLPRSRTETIAVFTVVHHWADPAVPAAEAVFLETWILEDRAWRIRRHTAEKR